MSLNKLFFTRPLCLFSLLCIGLLFLLDQAGLPLTYRPPLSSAQVEQLANDSVQVAGVVREVKETEGRMSVFLQDAKTLLGEEMVSLQGLRVYLKNPASLLPGDTLACEGNLSLIAGPTNPGEFDSALYYACEHTYYNLKKAEILSSLPGKPSPKRLLWTFRQRCSHVFSLCAGQEAPLFDALLLGDKSLLSEETKTKFQLAGIIHLLAISGLHISLVGLALGHLLGYLGLGLHLRNALCLLLVLSFGMLTGNSVSTLRAVSSYLLAVGAKGAGRSTDLPTTLSVTALLILLEAPAYLYSASFLLSFGAVISLAFYVPPVLRSLKPLLPHQKHLSGLLTSLLSSALISLGTMPIVLYYYGEVSLAGCLLNLIVLPTAGVILASGGIALLLSLPPGGLLLSQFAIYPARGLLWLYDLLCEGALRLPFCTLVGGRCSLPSALAYYALLGFGLAFLMGKVKLPVDILQTGKRNRNQGHGNQEAQRMQREIKKDARNEEAGEEDGRRGKKKNEEGKKKNGRRKERNKEDGRRGKERDEERKKKDGRKREVTKRALSFTFLTLLAVFLLTFHPRQGLSITCLDIGQGDAIVIQTPEGKNYLMDGGSTSRNKVGTYVLLPYLKSQGISHLDGIFLSHTDEDHYNGMKELLEARRDHLSSISIEALYLPSWESPPPVWEELFTLGQEAGAKVIPLKRGDILLSGKVSFTVLTPFPGATGEDPNEDGMVLRISYGAFVGLLTGDIGFETEDKLLAASPISNQGSTPTSESTDSYAPSSSTASSQSTVTSLHSTGTSLRSNPPSPSPDSLSLSPITYLKVGHHGSGGSSGEAFLSALSPKVGAISCAKVNRYGHPSKEAVKRLENAGCALQYTMEGGAITLLTDGKRYEIQCFVKSQAKQGEAIPHQP